MDAIGVKDRVESRKWAFILHVFSDNEVEIYKTLKIKNKEWKLENILKKFETFFVTKFNVTYKRRKFLTCV